MFHLPDHGCQENIKCLLPDDRDRVFKDQKDIDPTDGLHGGSHFYVGESDGHVYVDAGTIPVNQKWSYDGKQREYIIVPLSQYDSTKKSMTPKMRRETMSGSQLI